MRRVLALAIVWRLAGAAPAASAQGITSFELVRGVVADVGAGRVYLADPDGGVAAVALANGNLRWRIVEASLPLAAGNGLVAALGRQNVAAGRLAILILEAATGRRRFGVEVALTEGARALVADEPGASLRATAAFEKDRLLVSSSYERRQVQGVAPPLDSEPQSRKLSGAVQVDLSTGKVVAGEAPRRTRAPLPDAVERLVEAKALTHGPWVVGRVLVATQGGTAGPLVLKTWDARSGKALGERLLSEAAVAALPSADERQLLVVERASAPGAKEYLWGIFELSSGRRIGGLPQESSAAPFFLW